MSKLDKNFYDKNIFFLIYRRPDFDLLIFVPNLNVTLSFDIHLFVVKSGLRADLNECDLRVLLVDDIYSLETGRGSGATMYHPIFLTKNACYIPLAYSTTWA